MRSGRQVFEGAQVLQRLLPLTLTRAHALSRESSTAAVSYLPSSGPARLRVLWSDEALFTGLCEGRPNAAAALFDRYAVHVYRVLAHVLGPDPDLVDLAQDVFVTAL